MDNNKHHEILEESMQSKGRRSCYLYGGEKELGEAAHWAEGNSKVWWIILASHVIELFRNFPSPSKKIYCSLGIRSEVGGESKVELRKLKTTHPHFLISFKGGVIGELLPRVMMWRLECLYSLGEKNPFSATSFHPFNWLIFVCQKPRQFQTK